MTTSQVLPARLPESPALQLAVAGYLARFKGISRTHAESDLRAYLGWCADRGLEPLAASRPHVELYVRWMQEVRRLRPSTVSRRTSIVAGSTGPRSSTACSSIPRPSTSAAPTCRPTHPPSG
jgi:integrase/recombinase XerD